MARFQSLNLTATYRCAHCGEAVTVEVDPSAGPLQQYVEDCQVCCRPNVLTVRFAADGSAAVETTPE